MKFGRYPRPNKGPTDERLAQTLSSYGSMAGLAVPMALMYSHVWAGPLPGIVQIGVAISAFLCAVAMGVGRPGPYMLGAAALNVVCMGARWWTLPPEASLLEPWVGVTVGALVVLTIGGIAITLDPDPTEP